MLRYVLENTIFWKRPKQNKYLHLKAYTLPTPTVILFCRYELISVNNYVLYYKLNRKSKSAKESLDNFIIIQIFKTNIIVKVVIWLLLLELSAHFCTRIKPFWLKMLPYIVGRKINKIMREKKPIISKIAAFRIRS